MSTKQDLIDQMRTLQQQYAALAEQLKAIKVEEEREGKKARQLALLESFKTKYKFWAKLESPEIDWAEVDKLINTSFGQPHVYMVTYDSSGMPGLLLVVDGSPYEFQPMVEEESDIRKYNEREANKANAYKVEK